MFAQDRTTTLYPIEIMFALVALVVLLVIGRVMEELEWSGIGIIFLIVVVVAVIVSATGLHPALMTAVYALIDVGLILKIFKGDLRTF